MNLTKCFAAGLCLTAMTASAGFIQTNAFEVGELNTGWSFGASNWDSEGLRVANDASRTAYAGVRPLADAANAMVLKLDTQGGIWTNKINGEDGQSFALTNLFVDMLVRFVPSEELPVVDSLTKLAIAVTNNLLAVTKDDGSGGNEWFVTATTIDTGAWQRVTVKLVFETPYVKATVSINGTNVTVAGNTLFNITDNDGFANLKSIGVQGTGYMDEVAVRNDNPFGTTTVFGTTTNVVINPAQLATWNSTKNGGGPEVNAEYDAFLMNVAPDAGDTSPALVVNSITKGGNVVLTVQVKYANDTLVDLGTPLNNGAVLKVWGKAALTDGSWTLIGTNLTFDPTTYKFFMLTVAP